MSEEQGSTPSTPEPEPPKGKKTPATANTDLSRFDMAVTERMALELRRDGLSYAQIGEQMGCTTSAAWKRVKRALKAVVAEPAAEVLTLERQRYDHLLDVVMKIVDDPNKCPETRLLAVDRALRISALRAKIEGLEAPTKVEHRVLDSLDAKIEALAAELGAIEADTFVEADVLEDMPGL